jgi:WASH complex subunit CCDC53
MQGAIDYTEVPPVSPQTTLAFINNFLINTTQFLNRFTVTCDQKLKNVAYQVQRLEITMSLLEAKLNSIEGLADADGGAAQAAGASSAPPPADGSIPPPPPPPGASASNSDVPANVAAPAAPEHNGMTVSQDPRYMQYFKMLKVGVALANVQSKMMAAGVDPSLLEFVLHNHNCEFKNIIANTNDCSCFSNPNAPSDYTGATSDSEDEPEEEEWED